MDKLTPEENAAIAAQERQKFQRVQWLRRQAMNIVLQLPEEEADALAVLDCARALVKPEAA